MTEADVIKIEPTEPDLKVNGRIIICNICGRKLLVEDVLIGVSHSVQLCKLL